MRKLQSFKTLRIIFPALLIGFFAHSGMASTIQGFVYDKKRNPLVQVDIELLNENYQMRARTKSDGAGRYTFGGLSDGRYTVRVLPFRYDLEDQEASVEIITLDVRGSGMGNQVFAQDFHLAPKRGGLMAAENEVIFAQTIPADALKLYGAAVSDLSTSRRVDGIRGLRSAIAIFPNYFNAIHRLGKELIADAVWGEAAQLMIRAAEINPKSAYSYYYAGTALHNLGPQYNKGAIVALNAALQLAPASVQVLYMLGKLERIVGDRVSAEKHLVSAKKLSKQPIPEIHSELAQLYGNDLKRYDAAASELELYIKASKLTPQEEEKTRGVIASLKEKSKARPSN